MAELCRVALRVTPQCPASLFLAPAQAVAEARSVIPPKQTGAGQGRGVAVAEAELVGPGLWPGVYVGEWVVVWFCV